MFCTAIGTISVLCSPQSINGHYPGPQESSSRPLITYVQDAFELLTVSTKRPFPLSVTTKPLRTLLFLFTISLRPVSFIRIGGLT